MGRRIKAALIGLGVVAAIVAAPSPAAQAAVPYSWWCYKAGHPSVHVYTPGGVGYWTAYQGYRCYGGFYSYV